MGYTKDRWYDTFSTNKERGVRSKGGYICFLPKPNHYSGQDKRYEEELSENKANAKLIAAAPDLYEALKRWQDQWVVNPTPQQAANNYSIEIQINNALNKAEGN